ncbi:MAG: D-alanine--D-alanine ligase, partial [Bacteroidetes bacterium]|nr:D-alanine--D-alanine ligase [Bacteroidota bacterium]
MNVALAYNVKPESDTFTENLPPIRSDNFTQTESVIEAYAEWDTWETIIALKDAIEVFHNVTLIEADNNAFEKFKQSKPDIVFNIAEGFNNLSRESQIPAMLDMLNIPYTGSDALTLGICLDKARTKEILSYYKIPNANFILVDKIKPLSNHSIEFPSIVKPVSEGSSKGIFNSSLVRNYDELNAEIKRVIDEYNQPAIIEEFLPGKEFTVALIGNGDNTEIFPIVEIKYENFPDNVEHLYSYEAKWTLDTKDNVFDVFECPAAIDNDLEKQIKDTALRTYNVLR